MLSINRFNYIITIHNKEKLIDKVIRAIISCCGTNSKIYPVLDGCTDKSEDIINKLIMEFPNIKFNKIITSDVHEIKSINAALRKVDAGYNIILQDDVVLEEPNLEKKVLALYNNYKGKLGFVSFRLGANVKKTRFKKMIEECDLIENIYGNIKNCEKITPGNIAFRMVAIKSPVCIPPYLLENLGILDENLVPYCYDDHEYSLRALEKGYENALFPIKFTSKLEWGGTREDKNFPKECTLIHKRNRTYVYKKYNKFLKKFKIPPEYKKSDKLEFKL